MDRFNAENERIKRDYAEFLREADQKSEASVRGVEKAILRFEEYRAYCDFGRFNRDQANGFRAALSSPHDESKRLGNSTVLSNLKAMQRFFRWLSVQPGFKSKTDTNAIACFNLSEKDIRAATSSPTKPSPIMDQLKRAFDIAGLPYFSPHRVRSPVVEYAYLTCRTPEELNACSQKLGHERCDDPLALWPNPASAET